MWREYFLTPIALLLFHSLAFADNMAPTGTLRAAYLSSNPAQAVRDRTTGDIRGASADLARELHGGVTCRLRLCRCPILRP